MCWNNSLTHLRLASLLWDIGKQHSPRCDAASHLGLFCLLREISSKKIKITPNTPKNESGLTQLIMMGKSIRQIRVNLGHDITSLNTGSALELIFFFFTKKLFICAHNCKLCSLLTFGISELVEYSSKRLQMFS